MNGEINRLDDLFREGMEGHLEMPSPQVWEKIEEELDKKDRRRPFVFFFSSYKKVAAVLLIGIISASLFAGGYFLINKYSSNKSDETTLTENAHTEKGVEEKKITNTQPKENTTHHIPVDTDTKIFDVDTVSENQFQLTDDSKDQLIKKSPSNEAVANRSNVKESVPFKNKTVVAGSRTINKSAGNIDNNASSAVKATEEQTNLATIATVQWRQHEFASIEKSVVTIQPIPTKTPTTLSAPVTPVNPTQIPVLAKKKNKNIYFSITPIALKQTGKIRVKENLPPLPVPMPFPLPPSAPIFTPVVTETNYRSNLGLLGGVHWGNKFSIQTGFNYSTQYFVIPELEAVLVQRPDGKEKYALDYSMGKIFIEPKLGNRNTPGSTQMISDVKTSFTYIQIPIVANYYIGKGKIQGYINAGGSFNFLTDLSVSANMFDIKEKHKITDKETPLTSSYINGLVGIGLKWNFSKYLSVIISPQYQYALTPNFKVPFIKTYADNLTIQTGIQVNLRK